MASKERQKLSVKKQRQIKSRSDNHNIARNEQNIFKNSAFFGKV